MLFRVCIFVGFGLVGLTSGLFAQETDAESGFSSLHLDDYVDSRFEAGDDATLQLIQLGEKSGTENALEWESRIRQRRASYPDASKWVGKYSTHFVECYHVDYSSRFLMYLPDDYDPNETYSLVVVGHGGNSSMSASRAYNVARQYIQLYAPEVTSSMKAIVVAPASERGWGPIGYSLVFSTISQVKKMVPIDPDRVYLTGQSMGGHLSYRMALTFADRIAAVAPHSGGYDFVAKESIGNLLNVPGVAVFGAREPYGINGDNKTNAKWGKQHGLNWKFVEKNGGHTIYQDELGPMANFFAENPRDLYRKSVYLRQGGTMHFVKTWEIKGWPDHKIYKDRRPMMWNTRHWIQVKPRPDCKTPLELIANNLGENQIEITCSEVRQLSVYLHPKMVDMDQPVTIKVNGEVVFRDRVKPDVALMLDTVRTFGDRGRIFWAKVDLEVTTDSKVVIPVIEADGSADEET